MGYVYVRDSEGTGMAECQFQEGAPFMLAIASTLVPRIESDMK